MESLIGPMVEAALSTALQEGPNGYSSDVAASLARLVAAREDRATTSVASALARQIAAANSMTPDRRVAFLGEFLKQVREALFARDITYAQVGLLAGYSAETVRAQLSGRRALKFETVEAVASLLNGSVGQQPGPAPALGTFGLSPALQQKANAAIRAALTTPPERGVERIARRPADQPWTVQGDNNIVTVNQAATWRSAPPDPMAATTVAQFHAKLVELHIWDGAASLRTLAERNSRLSRSTVSDLLRREDHLPKLDLLRAFVLACGAGGEWPRWELAWQRLKLESVPGQR